MSLDSQQTLDIIEQQLSEHHQQLSQDLTIRKREARARSERRKLGDQEVDSYPNMSQISTAMFAPHRDTSDGEDDIEIVNVDYVDDPEDVQVVALTLDDDDGVNDDNTEQPALHKGTDNSRAYTRTAGSNSYLQQHHTKSKSSTQRDTSSGSAAANASVDDSKSSLAEENARLKQENGEWKSNYEKMREKAKKYRAKAISYRDKATEQSDNHNAARVQALEDEVDSLSTKLQTSEAKVTELTALCDDYSKAIEEMRAQYDRDMAARNKERAELNSEICTLETKFAKLSENSMNDESDEIATLKSEIASLKDEVAKSKNNSNEQDLKSQLKKKDSEISRLQLQLNSLTDDNFKLKQRIVESHDDTLTLSANQRMEESSKQLKVSQESLQKVKEVMVRHESDNKALRNELTKKDEQMRALVRRNTELEEMLKGADNRMSEYEMAVKDLEGSMTGMSRKQSQLKDKSSKYEQMFRNSQTERGILESKLKAAQSEITTLRELNTAVGYNRKLSQTKTMITALRKESAYKDEQINQLVQENDTLKMSMDAYIGRVDELLIKLQTREKEPEVPPAPMTIKETEAQNVNIDEVQATLKKLSDRVDTIDLAHERVELESEVNRLKGEVFGLRAEQSMAQMNIEAIIQYRDALYSAEAKINAIIKSFDRLYSLSTQQGIEISRADNARFSWIFNVINDKIKVLTDSSVGTEGTSLPPLDDHDDDGDGDHDGDDDELLLGDEVEPVSTSEQEIAQTHNDVEIENDDIVIKHKAQTPPRDKSPSSKSPPVPSEMSSVPKTKPQPQPTTDIKPVVLPIKESKPEPAVVLTKPSTPPPRAEPIIERKPVTPPKQQESQPVVKRESPKTYEQTNVAYIPPPPIPTDMVDDDDDDDMGAAPVNGDADLLFESDDDALLDELDKDGFADEDF